MIAQGEILAFLGPGLAGIAALLTGVVALRASGAKRTADVAAAAATEAQARATDAQTAITSLTAALARSDSERQQLGERIGRCERNMDRLVRQVRGLGAIPDLEGI